MTSEPPVVGEPQQPEREQKSLVRRFGPAVVGIAAILLVFLVLLPRIANYSDVWDVVTGLSNEALVALAAATAINVATYGPPWMAALPGLNYRQSMVLTQTSSAISIAVPGGDAVGLAASYAMLRSWGYRSNAIAVAVVVTGAWNQIVNVTLPMLALALLLLTGGSSTLLLTAGLIGMGVIVFMATALVLAFRSDRAGAGLGRPARSAAPTGALRLVRRTPRSGWGAAMVRFRGETVHLLARRWHVITLAAFVGHLTVFGVLLVCLRATGVPSIGGDVGGGDGGLGSGAPADRRPDHAGRRRHRRAGPVIRAGRLRRRQRGGGGGGAALPRSDGGADVGAGGGAGAHVAEASGAGAGVTVASGTNSPCRSRRQPDRISCTRAAPRIGCCGAASSTG